MLQPNVKVRSRYCIYKKKKKKVDIVLSKKEVDIVRNQKEV